MSHQAKYWTPLFVCLILFSESCFSQEILTLESAVSQAIQNNFSIKIARSREEINRNDNTRGNAGMLPVVTGATQANFTNSSVNQEFFPVGTSVRAPLIQSGVDNRNTNTNINAVWTVYDGMGMYATAERLREVEKLGKTNVEIAIETAVAQVSVSYYDIIRQKQRLKALSNALEISNTRLELAKANYEVGTTAKSDYLAAQVDYNEDQAALMAQEQNLQNSKITLNALMLRDFAVDFNVPDTILVDRSLDIISLRTNLLTQNPTILAANLNRKVASIVEREVKSARMPQIDLLTGYGFNTTNNEVGFGVKSGRTGTLNYGARLSIPIFDGYNQRRREQNSRINTIIAEQQELELKNILQVNLERTFNNYRNSIKLLDIENQNLKIARQNAGLAFERYKFGNSTAIEFREAQRNAIANESRLIEAAHNTKIAEIELLRLSSSILENVK
jgi:outer membrane protein